MKFDIFGFYHMVYGWYSRGRSWVVGSEVKTVDSLRASRNFILPWARAALPVFFTLVFLLRRLRGELTEHISEHIRERHQLLLPLLLGHDLPAVLHDKLEIFQIISPIEPRSATTFMTRGLRMSVEWRSASMSRSRQFEMLTDWHRTSSHFLFRCFSAYWNI